MSGRYFIGVIVNQEFRVAQYCVGDGSVDVAGKNIVNFLKSFDKEVFLKKLNLCSFLSEKDWRKIVSQIQSEYQELFALPENERQIEISVAIARKYPQYNTRTAEKILSLIYELPASIKKFLLYDRSDVFEDTILCGYAYVINLDTDEFTIYGNHFFWEKNYTFSELSDMNELKEELMRT